MPSAYPYLISSLPTLVFGTRPPFGIERFLEQCESQIPQADLESVKLCFSEEPWDVKTQQQTLRQWINFETALRNELVRVRAARKKVDPARFLRGEAGSEPAFYQLALNSHRITHPADAEKFLDQARWQALEELSASHYFDLDALIAYALKLKILWRWERVHQADASAIVLEELVRT